MAQVKNNMKILKSFFSISLLSLLLVTGCASNSDDMRQSIITQRITGTWGEVFKEDGFYSENVMSLYKDGTMKFLTNTKIKEIIGVSTGRASGEWCIKGDSLHFKLNKTSMPHILPVGVWNVYKIITINDKECRYMEKGKMNKLIRVHYDLLKNETIK